MLQQPTKRLSQGFKRKRALTCRIMNKEVCLVINTPKAKRNYAEDRKTIRKVCLKYKVSYITTLAGAVAAVKGIESVKNGNGGEGGVKSLQEYHSLIK